MAHRSRNNIIVDIRMPYEIVKDYKLGRPIYAVRNTMTGEKHGWTTKEKAEAQMRLLYGVEHGMVPRKK